MIRFDSTAIDRYSIRATISRSRNAGDRPRADPLPPFPARPLPLDRRSEFSSKRKEIEDELAAQRALAEKAKAADDVERLERRRKKSKKAIRAATCKLSFDDDEEDGDEGGNGNDGGVNAPDAAGGGKFGKLGKNPAVKTDFLHDRERELEATREAIRMKAEAKDAIKAKLETEFDLHFAYWMPRGNLMQDVKKMRHSMRVKYGDTVGDFLDKFRDEHHREYRELAHVTGAQCMFAKEGLIIPHHHTWFELVQTGCVIFGKNVFADLDKPPKEEEEKEREREKNENAADGDDEKKKDAATREKDDAVAGGVAPTQSAAMESLKIYSLLDVGCVLDRRWFEQNRKTFPMVKWETYDATKDYRVAFVGDSGPAVVNTEHVS